MSNNANEELQNSFQPNISADLPNFASTLESDNQQIGFWFDKSDCICADSDACLEKMLFARDGQLSCADDALFWQAIKPCAPCYDQMCIEKKLRNLLISKISKKTVPLSLIEQIMQKIKNI